MSSYARTAIELRDHAVLFWPRELMQKEADSSIIPLLIKTQDKFISLLDVSDSGPEAWKQALLLTQELTPNLFLKHLMVLADIGGEKLKRIGPNFSQWFPTKIMTYVWKEKTYSYEFQSLNTKGDLNISNTTLAVDGEGLLKKQDLNAKIEDVAMLLLHSGAAVNANLSDEIREKCIIGTLIGQSAELHTFIKQRYILVSRITGGATANTMGQIAQQYVIETLRNKLPSWTFTSNGKISGVSQNAGVTETTFDVVAKSPTNTYVVIEISFQVTTNSVIERKAGQAVARARILRELGYKIAYVIDGAGNFERIP